MNVFVWIVCFIYGCKPVQDGEKQTPTIVNTTYGKLLGYVFKSRNGRTVLGYSGIPYAKPPVGERRFRDPEPPDSWSGVRFAIEYGAFCPQAYYIFPSASKLVIGAEDCLYLSVYSPNVKKKLPVVVYFYGSAYSFGSGEHIFNPTYLMDEDIVAITAASRINILGFLSLENNFLPGNYGLKDQTMILRWVQDNIANFGGDPNQITLMGESTGGASAHIHMFSPQRQNLFQKAILMSGNGFIPFAVIAPGVARKNTLKLANLIGCPVANETEIVECFRKVNSVKLLQQLSKFVYWDKDPGIIFGPVIDNYAEEPYIPDDPWKLPTPRIPIINGIVKYEGTIRSGFFGKNVKLYEEFDKNFNIYNPVSMFFNHTAKNPIDVCKKIKLFYFNNKAITPSAFEQLTNMYSDGFVLYPTLAAMRQYSGPQYLYYFDYLGKNSYADAVGPRILKSASHADDTIYIWKQSIFESLEMKDKELSKVLIKLFVNFVKHGKPTAIVNGSQIMWDEWKSGEEKFLHINESGFTIGKKLLKSREEFWKRLPYRDNFENLLKSRNNS